MQTSSARTTVLRYLQQLGRGTDLRPFLADDVRFVVAGAGDGVHSADAVARLVRHHYEVEFHAGVEVLMLIADGREVGAELRFAGTHAGRYAGLEATGRRVEVALAMFFSVPDGRIESIRVLFDPEQLMRQLRE